VGVIAIPYSLDPRSQTAIEAAGIPVRRPTLSELTDTGRLRSLIGGFDFPSQTQVAVAEIGGYCAPLLPKLQKDLNDRFVGVVEDTEAGHRRYSAQSELSVPILSAARSPLKQPEDRLVGESIAYSIERRIRSLDQPLVGLPTAVLGYGRIGSAVCKALAARGATVRVWDPQPERRIQAVAEGFASPDRIHTLQTSRLIIGASGATSLSEDDVHHLAPGTCLASATSRRSEFDVQAMQVSDAGIEGFERVDRGTARPVYLLDNGTPVNFADGAAIGPPLRLLQAELLLALSLLASRTLEPGLHEVADGLRATLSQLWIDHYLAADTGTMLT
jgi:adenosylhomocysteinase